VLLIFYFCLSLSQPTTTTTPTPKQTSPSQPLLLTTTSQLVCFVFGLKFVAAYQQVGAGVSKLRQSGEAVVARLRRSNTSTSSSSRYYNNNSNKKLPPRRIDPSPVRFVDWSLVADLPIVIVDD
jgi:hypothetical protein